MAAILSPEGLDPNHKESWYEMGRRLAQLVLDKAQDLSGGGQSEQRTYVPGRGNRMESWRPNVLLEDLGLEVPNP